MTSVILYAQSLASKWGFEDGNIIDDILWEAGFGDDPRPDHEHLFFHHEVLAEIVKIRLLPLCPEVPTYLVGTIHNPIRKAPDFDGEIPDVSVEVPAEDIVKVAHYVREQRAKRAACRVNTPQYPDRV